MSMQGKPSKETAEAFLNKFNKTDLENSPLISSYTKDITSLITAREGGLIVCIGCDTLTEALKEKGYRTVCIDESELDALSERADAVIYNDEPHWHEEKKIGAIFEKIVKNLKVGGELICELCEYKNSETLHGALKYAFNKCGLKYEREFEFPTMGDYVKALENCGLRAEYAVVFDKPTLCKDENAIRDWANTYAKKQIEALCKENKEGVLLDAEIYCLNLFANGNWYTDNVRTRIKAKNANEHDLASLLYELCPDFSLQALLDEKH